MPPFLASGGRYPTIMPASATSIRRRMRRLRDRADVLSLLPSVLSQVADEPTPNDRLANAVEHSQRV